MMFVLDTNILSTIMSPEPAPQVASWVAGQPETSLFTASICQAEILAGIAILPHGHRRQELAAAARAVFSEDFGGRVLPFDSDASAAYADIFAVRRKAGRPISTPDLMIASVARSRGASLVTRDIKGFEGSGLTLINPWDVA